MHKKKINPEADKRIRKSKEEHQDCRRTGIRRVCMYICMYNDDGGDEEASVSIAVGIPNGALAGSIS